MAQLIQQTLEQERWQREMIEQRYTQYTEDDEEVREGTDTASARFGDSVSPIWGSRGGAAACQPRSVPTADGGVRHG